MFVTVAAGRKRRDDPLKDCVASVLGRHVHFPFAGWQRWVDDTPTDCFPDHDGHGLVLRSQVGPESHAHYFVGVEALSAAGLDRDRIEPFGFNVAFSYSHPPQLDSLVLKQVGQLLDYDLGLTCDRVGDSLWER